MVVVFEILLLTQLLVVVITVLAKVEIKLLATLIDPPRYNSVNILSNNLRRSVVRQALLIYRGLRRFVRKNIYFTLLKPHIQARMIATQHICKSDALANPVLIEGHRPVL